jgi:hypothetical protein
VVGDRPDGGDGEEAEAEDEQRPAEPQEEHERTPRVAELLLEGEHEPTRRHGHLALSLEPAERVERAAQFLLAACMQAPGDSDRQSGERAEQNHREREPA